MCPIEEFKKANIQWQNRYLEEYGVDLGLHICKQNEIVLLYSLANYYVEVYRDCECNLVVKIKCTDSMKRIDPFLKQVNIDEIIPLLKID